VRFRVLTLTKWGWSHSLLLFVSTVTEYCLLLPQARLNLLTVVVNCAYHCLEWGWSHSLLLFVSTVTKYYPSLPQARLNSLAVDCRHCCACIHSCWILPVIASSKAEFACHYHLLSLYLFSKWGWIYLPLLSVTPELPRVRLKSLTVIVVCICSCWTLPVVAICVCSH